MAKRHFLQQSHKFSPTSKKHNITGRMLSEKLDGQRCYWDGGISRGLPKKEVPWANNVGDQRYLVPPTATGLWSRYGNVIHAPAWFLDLLPPFPLDGELWTRRGGHQECRSIISRLVPNQEEWKKVKFVIFDSPHYDSIFYDSTIELPNYNKTLSGCIPWIAERMSRLGVKNFSDKNQAYIITLDDLNSAGFWNNSLMLLNQFMLSGTHLTALNQYNDALSSTLLAGGEGLVTRTTTGLYLPERVHTCTKHKPYLDSEATVLGYVTGRETDKGSKLLGLMGSMIVSWKGKTFQLSGFTDQERLLTTDYGDTSDAYEWACKFPDNVCPENVSALHFPRGSKVTFRYRELSDDGVPKEASYNRRYFVE